MCFCSCISFPSDRSSPLIHNYLGIIINNDLQPKSSIFVILLNKKHIFEYSLVYFDNELWSKLSIIINILYFGVFVDIKEATKTNFSSKRNLYNLLCYFLSD